MKSKLLLSLFIFSLISCGGNSNEGASNSNARLTQESFLLDPSDFKKSIESSTDPTILDVRTPNEYNGGAIEGSINLDFYLSDFSNRVSKFDPQKTYFVYCHVGGRSGKVKEMMNQMGFENVYDLKGGISAWKKAGLDVINP